MCVSTSRGAWNYERLLAGAQLEAWGLIAVEVDAYNANAEALEREVSWSSSGDIGRQYGRS